MTRIDKAARVVIPAAFRETLALHPGDPVVLQVEQDSVRLIPLRQAIAEAQRRVRQFVPVNTPLVEALLRERLEDAQRE
jgi:AbrB family looped-hinge helix DNA binding protein